MKVLFICSGNSQNGIGTVVLNQAESLIKHGIKIDFFTIKGKGILGYLRNVPFLLRYLRNNRYEIIHSHYSHSAFIASFTAGTPLVVSLMGSDAYLSGFWRSVVRFFYRVRWKVTIVKTEKMRTTLRMEKALIIPNGVDLERFRPISRFEARRHIKYEGEKKLIVFIADPDRMEKNFELAKMTIQFLNRDDLELMPVFNVPHADIPFYLYAADVLLLTSLWEGSVNVVKEAMACDLPVVSTDVGDVKDNLINVNGSYICEGNPESLAKGLGRALATTGRTNGRDTLISLKLDSDSIAEKIIAIYNEMADGK